jgi:Pyruvate/2-oxoacid:ferredoxin oxidoreductase delta subunit
MDAVVGMEGDGPSNGTPRKIGLIMASKSSTALDFVACSVVSFDPMKVPTVKKAVDRQTGPRTIEEITIYGEDLEQVRIKDFKKPKTYQLSRVPPILMRTAKRVFAVKPVIMTVKCKKCGVCVKHCPPKAMSFKKGSVPAINYNQCIRCFCCQELCPEGAVDVSKPLLRKIFK